jgi:hypothetical protein
MINLDIILIIPLCSSIGSEVNDSSEMWQDADDGSEMNADWTKKIFKTAATEMKHLYHITAQ